MKGKADIGTRVWVIAGGHIPLLSTGKKPVFTSCDTLCILNVNREEVNIRMKIFHSDKPPTGPYLIKVHSSCTRHVRFNDLIDPEPLLLDVEFAAVIESDLPVVVQFTRMNTGQANLSSISTIAFSAKT